MKHIMLGAAEMRELLDKSSTEVGRVRIELSQGAVDEVVRLAERATDRAIERVTSRLATEHVE